MSKEEEQNAQTVLSERRSEGGRTQGVKSERILTARRANVEAKLRTMKRQTDREIAVLLSEHDEKRQLREKERERERVN